MDKTEYGHELNKIVESEMRLRDAMRECYTLAGELRDNVNKLLENVQKYVPDEPHQPNHGEWP